ncbi:hypothetical protein [Pantoea sp.]|uniref:hypothetical protein n=1 Tax=Pantoea sp. TaxID=69393 RepID=UPI0028ABABA1|nr:hypothetical protein [Pantoea sp.]
MSEFAIGSFPVAQDSGQAENVTPASAVNITNTNTSMFSNNRVNEKGVHAREVCHDKVFSGCDTEQNFYENIVFLDARFTEPRFEKPILFRNCTFAASKQPLQETFQLPDMKGVVWDNVTLDGRCNEERSLIPCHRLSYAVIKNSTLKDLVFSGAKNKALIDTDFTGTHITDVAFIGEERKPFELRNVKFNDINARNLEMGNLRCRDNVRFTNAKIDGLLLSQPVDFRGAVFGTPGSILLNQEHVSDCPKIFDHHCDDNHPRYPAILLSSLNTIINFELQRDAKEQEVQFFLDRPELNQALLHSGSLRQSMLSYMIKMSAHSDKIKDFLEQTLIRYHSHALLRESDKANITTVLRNIDVQRLVDYQFLVNQLPELRQVMNAQFPIKEFMDYARQFNKSRADGVIFYSAESEQAIFIPIDGFEKLIAEQVMPQHYLLLSRNRADNSITHIPHAVENFNAALENFPTLEALWKGNGRRLSGVILGLVAVPEYFTGEQREGASRLGNQMINLLTKVNHEKLNLEGADDVYLLKSLLTGFTDSEKRQALTELARSSLALEQYGLSADQEQAVAAIVLAKTFTNLFSATHCSTDEVIRGWLLEFAQQFLLDAHHYCPNNVPEDGVNVVLSQVDRPAAALFLLDTLQFNGENGAAIARLIQQHSPVF